MSEQLNSESARRQEDLPALAPRPRRCALSLVRVRDENFAFYGKTLRGQQETSAHAGSAARRGVDGDLGEALGQEYVVARFSPRPSRRRSQDGRSRSRPPWAEDIQGLPGWPPQPSRRLSTSCMPSPTRSAIPTLARLQLASKSVRGDFLGNVERARLFESQPPAGQDRQAASTAASGT